MKTPTIISHSLVAGALVSNLVLAGTVEAVTLASWDDWTDTDPGIFNADNALSGFTATVSYTETRTSTAFGSNDGTYGSSIAGANTTGGALLVREIEGGTVDVTVTNNTGIAYSIDSIHFDFAPRQNGNEVSYGYDSFTVTYLSGGLGPSSTQILSETGLSMVIIDTANAISNYPDYDSSLPIALTDTILGDGESAIFRFEFSGQTNDVDGPFTSSAFDNLAFQGAVIPEPTTFAMLCTFSLAMGVMLVRRKSARAQA